MPKPHLSCPYCGNPNPEIARLPGPATKALLEQAKMIVSGNVGTTWRTILQAFIDEWK
jgi:hypothetical protein